MSILSRLLLLVSLSLSACAPTVNTVPPPSPRTAQAFAIAANPLAARAGMEVLERGGSAVDAALAMQAMLSLVEPQSSGVGGGGFVNYYDARTRGLTIYDGRETAPAQATPTMFIGPDGKPIGFRDAVLSGRATGVPGALAALRVAYGDHGRLPWTSLFQSAERTAAEGFIVTPRLARMVTSRSPQAATPDAKAYFGQGPGGAPVKAGDRLKNPAYADFLRRLADQGLSAMYAGSTAAKIVERTRAGPLGGSMSMADLAAYQPIKRVALCAPWRAYRACVPPPPSSGVGLLQLLKMLERTDIASRGPTDPQAWYLFAEASRLMYADRDKFVGDPAFASVPVEGLLDPDYIAQRARLIGPTAGPPPVAGTPRGAPATAPDATVEVAGTSHFIVGDADGNVVSMTTTVESIFGSGRMVDGFFLNNQMTDFSFQPTDAVGRPQANAVAPGKRPRSSMTPLILIDRQGRFAGAIGSAGGNAILPFVAKSLVAAVDWGLPMQDAIAQPNLVARGSSFGGEIDKFSSEVIAGLKARGIDLKPGQGEDSGVHGVLIRNGRIDGGFDPRREGVVLTLP
ncbi:MAG: gamma-glutamyltransferase family protein [Pseudomonadota bacterium]